MALREDFCPSCGLEDLIVLQVFEGETLIECRQCRYRFTIEESK